MKTIHPHTVRLSEARPDLSPSASRRSKNNSEPILRNSIFVTHTPAIREAEAEGVILGIKKILIETRSRIDVCFFGNFDLGDGPFGRTEWYQEQALMIRERGAGRQANVRIIDRLLREEPYQKNNPHFDVMIVDHDLTSGDPENNFAYGYANYPNYIVSVARFRQRFPNIDSRNVALAVTSAHEMGHLFGLTSRNYNIGSSGYKKGHCNGESGPCLMEQVDVDDSRTIEEQTEILIDRVHWLCDDCLGEAAARRDHLEKNAVIW